MTREQQEIAEAVKSLRQTLGHSQQQFSNYLGMTVRTVARYELEVPPSGKMLHRLATIAEDVGRPDLKRVFGRAWIAERAADYSALSDISQASLGNALAWLLLFGPEGFAVRFEGFLKDELQKAAKEGTHPITDEDLEKFGRVGLGITSKEQTSKRGFDTGKLLRDLSLERGQIEEAIKRLESMAMGRHRKGSANKT